MLRMPSAWTTPAEVTEPATVRPEIPWATSRLPERLPPTVIVPTAPAERTPPAERSPPMVTVLRMPGELAVRSPRKFPPTATTPFWKSTRLRWPWKSAANVAVTELATPGPPSIVVVVAGLISSTAKTSLAAPRWTSIAESPP